MAVLLGRYWNFGKYTRVMRLLNHPIASQSVTRREFLKLGGMGIVAALGLFFPPSKNLTRLLNQSDFHAKNMSSILTDINKVEVLPPNQQGRVLDPSLNVYDIPSLNGTRVNTYWRDWIFPITEITIGKSEDSFNMVWYKLGDEGYVHSGSIQPVMTITNPVITNLPPGGTLAEVTVPFTDAHWDPGEDEPVAYRFYYATTYWVMEIVQDTDGNPWYGVRDDKWEYMFYVPASHMRLIPANELNPISANIPSYMKRIEVHIPEQIMIAFEYDEPVFMARIASGAVFSNGDYSTPTGKHQTFHKRASRHMARGNLAANGYDLPGVPWNSYITEDGIAFHGTYWHNNFGRPRSHGCINLTSQAAKWVYLWTKPDAPPDEEDIYEATGTNVDIIG
jgi:lipoprotein-anchoring transpeptidase ErfK/SrfK